MKDSLRLADVGERGWLDFLREAFDLFVPEISVTYPPTPALPRKGGGGKSLLPPPLRGRVGVGGTGYPQSSSSLLIPVGDDAAVLRTQPAMDLVVTSDAMVEGTHFRKVWLGWAGLARRSVLAAASDVTAMGGHPTGFLISLGVPGNTHVADLHTFARALAELAKDLNLVVLGGDTVRSRHILVDVTVLGVVPHGQALRQTGAVPGDALWVTGGLGKSRAFLEQILASPARAKGCLDDPRFLPPIRWTVLDSLRKTLPIRAMTDLSDGLALDLGKVLRGDNLGAEIHLDLVPISPPQSSPARGEGADGPPPPLRGRVGVGGRGMGHLSEDSMKGMANLACHECAFLGGEDYELLVVEQGHAQSQAVLDLEGVSLTRIGLVTGVGAGIQTFWKGRKRKVIQTPFLHFTET